MSATKKWKREFADGWQELHQGQRFARAKYLVEHGIEEGATFDEIAEATIQTDSPLSAEKITKLIQLYGIAEGAEIRPGTNFTAGWKRVKNAIHTAAPEIDD